MATETEQSLETPSVTKRCDSTATTTTKTGFPLGKAAIAAVLAGSLALAWEFQRPWFHSNLGTVDPGKVFRSAQPTDQLGHWIDDLHIKSILNLRGGDRTDWWYDAEVKTAENHGVTYFDYPLSATRRPTRFELLVLLDVLERCPYPLLIHCKSGADRTGLASALYRMTRLGEPPEQAEGAFSLEFGHVPFFGPEHLHEPLDEYARWLKDNRRTHTAATFRDWVKDVYESPGPHVAPPALPPGPRPSSHP
jgi:protein tyrosine phosphatase (PTP) superfamily phosphohydrolase (DUF442 family)